MVDTESIKLQVSDIVENRVTAWESWNDVPYDDLSRIIRAYGNGTILSAENFVSWILKQLLLGALAQNQVEFCEALCPEDDTSACFVDCMTDRLSFCRGRTEHLEEPFKSEAFVACYESDLEAYRQVLRAALAGEGYQYNPAQDVEFCEAICSEDDTLACFVDCMIERISFCEGQTEHLKEPFKTQAFNACIVSDLQAFQAALQAASQYDEDTSLDFKCIIGNFDEIKDNIDALLMDALSLSMPMVGLADNLAKCILNIALFTGFVETDSSCFEHYTHKEMAIYNCFSAILTVALPGIPVSTIIDILVNLSEICSWFDRDWAAIAWCAEQEKS